MTAVHPSPPPALGDDLPLLRHAVEEAARLLDADGAMVYLADSQEGRLRFAVDAGIRNPEAQALIRDLSLPLGIGIFGHAVERGEAVVTPDYRADARFRHSPIADRIVEVANMRSMAAAPLAAGGEVLGALGAYSSRVDDFDESRVGLLRALADHAAAAIANRRLIAELDRSRRELARRVEAQQTLGRIAAQITSLRSPDTVLQGIVDAARKLLGSDGAHLTLLESDAGVLRPTVMAGATDPRTRRWLGTQHFPLHEGINGLAAGTGELVSTRDYRDDPRIPHEPTDEATAERLGLRGMAAAPLRAPEGVILGTLAVSFESPHDFGEDELALLQGLADQGAIAISNARLADDLRRSEENLRAQATELAQRVEAQRTLADMAAQITSLRDPATVLAETLSEAVRLLGASGGQIGMIEAVPDGETRWSEGMSYVDGTIIPFTDADRTRTEPGVSGWAMRERRTVWTGDYLDDESFIHEPASDAYVREHGARSVMAAPLIGEDGPIGCLAVTADRTDAFDTEDANLLTTLASHAAIVLTNARLYREAQQANEQLAHRVVAQRALAEIAAQITSLRDPIAVLRGTVDEAKRLLGADHVVIHQLRTGTRELADFHDAFTRDEDGPPPDAATIDVGQGIAGRAVAERSVVWTADYLTDRAFEHTETADSWIGRYGYRSQMSAALIGEHGAVGAISAYSNRPAAFGPEEAELLGALASHAAIVLGNVSLMNELERRVETQRALGEIATRITAIREPADVLQGTLDEAVRLLDADGGRIELVDPSTGGLHWAYGHSAIDLPIERDDESDPVVPDEGISGLAVTEQRVVRTGDYLVDQSFKHAAGPDRYVRQHGIRSAMVAPLIGEDGAIGSLTVHSQARDAFDEDGAELLDLLAKHAAIAVTNARLYERLRDRVEAQRSLAEITSQIASLRDSSTVIQRAVSDAARLLGADRAQINLAREGADRLDPPIASAPEPPSPDDVDVPIGSGVAGMAASTMSVRWTGDYLADDSFPHDEGDARIRSGSIRSMMSAPLLGPELIGTITVQSTRANAFGQADAELLQLLADQAAIAISNARLYDELTRQSGALARQLDSQRRLLEVNELLLSTLEPAEVLETIADGLKRVVTYDNLAIHRVQPDDQPLRPVLARDRNAQAVMAFPIPRDAGGLTWWAIENRKPVRLDDALNDPRVIQIPGTPLEPEAMIIVPLVVQDEVVGAMNISRLGGPEVAFTDVDFEVVQLFATQAAIAMTNARLYEQLRARVDVQRTLTGIAAELTGMRHPAEILQRTVRDAARLLEAESSSINLIEREGEPMPWAYDYGDLGPLGPDDQRPVVREGEGIRGAAVARREVVWTGDYLDDPSFKHVPTSDSWSRRHNIRSVISAPLLAEGRPLGVLTVTSPRRNAFDADDADLVGALASQAAVAMTNARLYDELKDSERRYRHLVDNSPDIVWSLDADGHFTFLSDSLESRTGWKPAQLLGKPFTVLAESGSLAEARAAWELLRAHPDEEQRVRLDLPLADGSISQAEVAMTATVVNGQFAGAHGAVRDISERERLESDLRDQAAQLAASQERAHLARELHDSVTQALFSMGLTLRSLELLLEQNPEAAPSKLIELRELQKDALAEMRTLIFELRPASLETDGLVQALRHHATAVQGRTGLSVDFDAEPIDRLPLPTEEAIYRIGQEALHNVVKHANASRATIRLRREGSELRLEVEDDGVGFDPDSVPRGHIGLLGMRQRADLVGASLSVRSRQGIGTRIIVKVPWEPAPDK